MWVGGPPIPMQPMRRYSRAIVPSLARASSGRGRVGSAATVRIGCPRIVAQAANRRPGARPGRDVIADGSYPLEVLARDVLHRPVLMP
jgi:hypothetical protein